MTRAERIEAALRAILEDERVRLRYCGTDLHGVRYDAVAALSLPPDSEREAALEQARVMADAIYGTWHGCRVGSPRNPLHPLDAARGVKVGDICDDCAAAVKAHVENFGHALKNAGTQEASSAKVEDGVSASAPAVPAPEHAVGHPEDYCHKCGRPNIVWHAPNSLWNKVMPEDGILCPVCFVQQAKNAGVKPTSWLVTPEQDTPPSALQVSENCVAVPRILLDRLCCYGGVSTVRGVVYDGMSHDETIRECRELLRLDAALKGRP